MSKRLMVSLALAFLTTRDATAQPVNVQCQPVGVAVFQARVTVQCANGPSAQPNVVFFAMPTTNTSVVSNVSDTATRFIEVALAAWTSANSSLLILYDPSDTSSGATYGCSGNCMPAQAITLVKSN